MVAAIAPPKIPVIAGFEHIQRYWDPVNKTITAKILPGEYFVTAAEEMITTVLGSCVAACIFDLRHGVGGMNHFLLPEISQERLEEGREAIVGSSTRYGNYAMEHLINAILKQGGRRQDLEVKVFGGGQILASMANIGQRNIEFILKFIKTEGLTLRAQDLGDIYPRKVNFYPKTGRVMMKRIQDIHNDTIMTRESSYFSSLRDIAVEGQVELFMEQANGDQAINR